MRITSKLLTLVLACLGLAASVSPTFADDSEVFTNSAFSGGTVRPNVMFIIDTSGSMDTVVNSYDSTKDYSGSNICPDSDRVYWSTTNSAVPPDCRTSNQWVKTDNNRCYAGANGMANAGWWNGRMQQIITGGNPSFWGNLVPGRDYKIECSNDNGVHGDRAGTQAPGSEDKYARNGTGTSDSNRWGPSNASNLLSWT